MVLTAVKVEMWERNLASVMDILPMIIMTVERCV